MVEQLTPPQTSSSQQDQPESQGTPISLDPEPQVDYSPDLINIKLNKEVSLLYPDHANKDHFKVVSGFISKCYLREAFTRTPTQYKEYLVEFCYTTKVLDKTKLFSAKGETDRTCFSASTIVYSVSASGHSVDSIAEANPGKSAPNEILSQQQDKTQSSRDGITNNIPINLTFEKHNYESWSSVFRIHLGGLGLTSHIKEDTFASLSTSSRVINPDWCKLDDLVKMWILGSLHESLQDQVVTTLGNAKALWDHIQELFHDNKYTRAINLDNELHAIKLGNLSINAYCTKIKPMPNRLKNLGQTVSEKNLVMYAHNGRFKGIARLIKHREPIPSFSTTHNMLLLEESKINDTGNVTTSLTNSTSSSPTILVMTNNNTNTSRTNFLAMSNQPSSNNNRTNTMPQLCNHFPKGLIDDSIASSVQSSPKWYTSVAHFTRDNKCTIEFDEFGFSVKDFLTRHILLRCDSSSDLYPVTKPSSIPATLPSISQSTWHQRLGHPSEDVMRSFVSRHRISCNTEKSHHIYHACQLGKHVKLLFSSSDSVVSNCFNVIHSDLWTYPISSANGLIGTTKQTKHFILHASHVSPLPKSSVVALKDPNSKNAMYDEYNAFIKNCTWVLVPKPRDANIVRSMWIDCAETFSLAVKPAIVRTVLSLALSRKWPVNQLVVKNGFLNGHLSKTMCDLSLFIYRHGTDTTYLLIYVEDIIHTACISVHRDSTESKLSPEGVLVAYATLYRSLAEPHLAALKRILRYVHGTLDFGLQIYVSSTSSLIAYTNDDWAGCPATRHLTSRNCVFLGDNLLSWSTKRQHTLSRSGAEVEYRDVVNVVVETAWARNLLQELHAPLFIAIYVYSDNYVDIFTTGLPSSLFEDFRTSLSVRSSPAQTTGEFRFPEDDQPFMVESDEEEVHAESHAETDDTSVPQCPSPKTIKIQKLSTQLLLLYSLMPSKLKELPSKISDINEAMKGLKQYVKGMDIKILDLLAGLHDLPKQVSSNNAQLSKLKVLDALPREQVKKDKGKKALSHEEADEEECASDSKTEVRLSGSLVESSKQKHLKKFTYIDEHGESFLMTKEEIKKQKRIEQNIKVDIAKAKIEEGKDELIDLLGLEVVERMYKDKVKYDRTGAGWTTIYSQIQTRMENLHKTKEELELDFNKPLGEQDPIIKLNTLAKKKRKHANDIHNYFRSTEKYKTSLQFADH
ncbi:ribonuclease H-like domain-containing protein [Tanacetum coccineum]